MIALLVPLALAAPAHEAYVSAGVGYQGGATVVAGGVGGSVGYRLWLGEQAAVHVDVGPRLFLVPAAEIDVGGSWSFLLGERWSISVGAELASMVGGSVRRITESDIDPLRGPPVAARVLVRPIEYRQHELTVRALGLSGGVGLDAPGRSLAVGVDLLEVGWAF